MWWQYENSIATIRLNALQKKAADMESAFSYVADKVEEPNLKDTLTHEYSMYNNILTQVDNAFKNYNEVPNNYKITSNDIPL